MTIPNLYDFTNGTVANAEEVDANFNIAILKPLCSASGVTNYKEPVNAITTSFTNGTNASPGNISKSLSKCCWSGVSREYIAGGTIFDTCDNSSVDATKWTTSGSVSEDTEYITISGASSTLTSNGASGLNMNSGVTYVLVQLEHGTGSSMEYIQLTNTSTTVTLVTDSSYYSDPVQVYLIKIDATNNLANVWLRNSSLAWTQVATDTNISTVTTNKYLRFATAGGGGGSWKIHKVCYYNTDATSDLVTSTKTVSSFTKAGIFWEGTGTITGYLSSNGTDYTAVDSYGFATLSAGTSLKAKLTLKTNNSNSPDTVSMLGCQTW